MKDTQQEAFPEKDFEHKLDGRCQDMSKALYTSVRVI